MKGASAVGRNKTSPGLWNPGRMSVRGRGGKESLFSENFFIKNHGVAWVECGYIVRKDRLISENRPRQIIRVPAGWSWKGAVKPVFELTKEGTIFPVKDVSQGVAVGKSQK